MKYVICKRNNVYLPVFGAEHVNHSDLVVPNSEIVGAGRCSMRHGLCKVEPCTCTSIDFTTVDTDFDERILQNAIYEQGMNAFIDWDSI